MCRRFTECFVLNPVLEAANQGNWNCISKKAVAIGISENYLWRNSASSYIRQTTDIVIPLHTID